MPLPPDPLSAKYTLECTWPGCGGTDIVSQNLGVGWAVGTLVPMDPSNDSFARCRQCKRHKMRVTKAPEPPAPKKPKGFTKIPTE